MPMSCSICGHRKRQEIDRALLEKRPLRHTAAQFSTSTGALQRHRAHIHRDLVEAHQAVSRAEQFARAVSLLADVRTAEGRAERLLEVAEDILEKAREAEDLKTAIGAIRAAAHAMAERRQFMELRGELTGELPNVAGAAADVPLLIKVLSVPRLPGVQARAVQAIQPGVPPAAESRVVDMPVESSDIPARNRR